MNNLRSACDTLVDSILRIEATSINDKFRNSICVIREKVEKYVVTEQELVTLMLLGEDIRTEDAWLATDLDMWCLEVIHHLRYKSKEQTNLLSEAKGSLNSALRSVSIAYELTDDDKLEELLFDAEQDIKNCRYCMEKAML